MPILINDEPGQFHGGPGLALGAAAGTDIPGGPITYMMVIMFGGDGIKTILRIDNRKNAEELLLTISKTRDIVWPPTATPEN